MFALIAGALTKGDRRAATGADLTEFNFDTQYGRLALRTMYHHISKVSEISNIVVCVTSKGSDQPAHTCSLIRAFASRLNIL